MTQTITRNTDGGAAPLSYAQELLWQLDRATPGMAAYNAPRVIHVRGELDVTALRVALDTIVERHEILRTTYHLEDGAVVQRVRPHRPFAIEVTDLRASPDAVAESERRTLEAARAPFDFERDLFLRASLFRVADTEWTLVLASHHVVSDGWSRDVLFRELGAAYDAARLGEPLQLPALPVQFADFARWQRARGESEAFEHELSFWLDQLAEAPILQLPTTFARPVAASFAGSLSVAFLLPSLVAALRQFAVERGATLYMVLLAAYQSLLHRYTGQDDIIVGSAVAARDLEEIEGLIGYFANTLAMRTRFVGDPTFAQVVDQVIDASMDAYEHVDVPFEQVQLRLRAQGAMRGDASLVRAVLTMEDTLSTRLTLGDADVTLSPFDYGQSKFDMALLVTDTRESLRLSLWYRTDLFDAEFADGALRHLEALIAAAIEAPDTPVGQLALLSEAERAQLAAFGDGGKAVALPTRLDLRVAEHARRTPDRVAVRSGDATVTYAELDARANGVARRLDAAGATECVGVCEDNSIDAIVGIVGVLRAGRAYVPMPPHTPAARLRQQASDAGVEVVLCSEATTAAATALGARIVTIDDQEVTSAAEQERPSCPATPTGGELAYVLFTSGSTGTPKGVAVTHSNLAAYVGAICTRLGVPDEPWTFGLVSSIGADLGNTALFPALATGGTVDVVPRAALLDPAAFAEYVAKLPMDVLKITPSHLQALCSGPSGMGVLPRCWLITGGEALSLEFARDVLGASQLRLLNHYGPTEATIGCCTYEVHRDCISATSMLTVPIGRPLPGVRARVVDAAGNPAPVGIPGELWIEGAGVAAGYVAHPEWTAERFVVAPSGRGSAYRTGDRARWLASGALEFLGRADDQVKVRGFRVELGEVEAALDRCAGLTRAVVIARGEGGDRRLVAFIEGGATPATVRDALADALPDYMVPSDFVPVTSWPLTRSGKIDRQALAATAVEAVPALLPRTDTERRLVDIWSAVLKRDGIGVRESFFDLGGHSLLAIRVLGRISRDLGVRLPLRTLFEAVTIEALARVVDAELHPVDEEAALREALAAVAALSESEVTGMLDAPVKGNC